MWILYLLRLWPIWTRPNLSLVETFSSEHVGELISTNFRKCFFGKCSQAFEYLIHVEQKYSQSPKESIEESINNTSNRNETEQIKEVKSESCRHCFVIQIFTNTPTQNKALTFVWVLGCVWLSSFESRFSRRSFNSLIGLSYLKSCKQSKCDLSLSFGIYTFQRVWII